MKIAALETLRIEAFPNLLWVIVEDEEGVRGVGESFFEVASTETWLHDYAAPKLIGRDLRDRDAIQRALRPYVGYDGSGAETRGMSGIDLALWDLWGLRLGQPIWALLGGRCRERIRTYNTCAGYGYVRGAEGQKTGNWGLGQHDGPYEDLVGFLTDAGKVAESLLAQGITGMKIWPFDFAAEASMGAAITPEQLAQGVEPFRKVREAVGDAMELKAELHLLWDATAAGQIAEALRPFRVEWIEDPMPASSAASWADLRRRIGPAKLAGSETLATRARFREFMAAGALDVVIMDLAWCGGLTEAKAIADMADAFHLPIAPHDCTGPLAWAACTHLTLHARNAKVMESVRAFHSGWYAELAEGLPVVEDGHIHLPDAQAPGLGARLRPQVFDRPDAALRRSG